MSGVIISCNQVTLNGDDIKILIEAEKHLVVERKKTERKMRKALCNMQVHKMHLHDDDRPEADLIINESFKLLRTYNETIVTINKHVEKIPRESLNLICEALIKQNQKLMDILGEDRSKHINSEFQYYTNSQLSLKLANIALKSLLEVYLTSQAQGLYFDQMTMVEITKSDSVELLIVSVLTPGLIIDKIEFSSAMKDSIDLKLVDPWIQVQFRKLHGSFAKATYYDQDGIIKETLFEEFNRIKINH